MTEFISVTDTAKLVRAALKAAHPGVKFSVRSNSYAGGNSIDVAWTDGPTEATVDRTAQLYAGATFDASADCKNYRGSALVSATGEIRDVHFCADFVFTRRTLSEAYKARLADLAREHLGDFDPDDYRTDHPCFDTPAGFVRGGTPHAVMYGLAALYPA